MFSTCELRVGIPSKKVQYQKEPEMIHFLAFKAALTDFPAGAVEGLDDPDVRVRLPHGLLGIEHTEYVRKDGGRD